MIEKLKKSIQFAPVNIILMALTVFLYLINNLIIKDATSGWIRVFFVGYFNDCICPLFFLSYVNCILLTAKKELTKLRSLMLMSCIAGLFWEFAAPLVKPSAVTDLWDFVCYMIGSVLYWWLFKVSKYLQIGEEIK